MSYNDLILQEGVKSNYLVVMKPQVRVDTWSFHAVSIYKNSFLFGNIINVSINGVALTEVFTASLLAGQYFWDYTNSVLYVRKSDSTAPTTTDFIIATIEIYVGTSDAHWYREPINSSSRIVYFDALITTPPEIKISMSDGLLGYIPVGTTTIKLDNSEHTLEYHLYYASYNQKDVDVYHWLGDLDVLNIKKVMQGKLGNITADYNSISIQIKDSIDIFSKEYRLSGLNNFYSVSLFPGLDINHLGRPIRYVYGMVNDIYCVNIDYSEINNLLNRNWVVRNDGSNTSSFSSTVPAAPVSTANRTYLNSVIGLNIDDKIYLNHGAGYIATVLAVGSNYVDHNNIGVPATTGTVVTRGTVGNAFLIQGGVTYPLYYTRDWIETSTNNCLVLALTAGAEASIGANPINPKYDKIYCRVYGKQNNVTIGGNPFGSDSAKYGNLTNPAVILFDILKGSLGLSETQINTTDFSDLSTLIGLQEVGFSIPRTLGNNFPKYTEILTDFIQSNLLRIYQDNDNKWTASKYSLLTSGWDFGLYDDEILRGSINYSFDYSDLVSDIIIQYLYSEVTNEYQKAAYTNNLTVYLHNISKQNTYNTILLNSSDASQLSIRIGSIFGDRQGRLSIDSKNRFFTAEISNIINLFLEKLPGCYYNGSMYNRLYRIIELNKSLRRINILLDDQKGAQDNAGSF